MITTEIDKTRFNKTCYVIRLLYDEGRYAIRLVFGETCYVINSLYEYVCFAWFACMYNKTSVLLKLIYDNCVSNVKKIYWIVNFTCYFHGSVINFWNMNQIWITDKKSLTTSRVFYEEVGTYNTWIISPVYL